jgi:hypothetical protein
MFFEKAIETFTLKSNKHLFEIQNEPMPSSHHLSPKLKERNAQLYQGKSIQYVSSISQIFQPNLMIPAYDLNFLVDRIIFLHSYHSVNKHHLFKVSL